MRRSYQTPRARVLRIAAIAGVLAVLGAAAAALLPTTINDFRQPGTQPGTLQDPVVSAVTCRGCHGEYDPGHDTHSRWSASLMAQSARDPIFHAALAIANQDAAFAGEFCLRCHTPGGWLEGRSTPPDGSALTAVDRQGVNCQACHRLVDPVYTLDNPIDDQDILANLPSRPATSHNGQMIFDPQDRRRTARDMGHSFYWHPWRKSPYHREALLCATCHEVSNPAFTRQSDGTYALGSLDAPHPTHNPRDEFPIERTFSEWANSAFAQGPIDMGGRFGGANPRVGTCVDCHMPRAAGYNANPIIAPFRRDMASHDFHGANSWVLRAVHNLYPESETGLTADSVAAAEARTREMLAAASDLEITQDHGQVIVRIVNQSGHKLPTGYGEGRRMWINVQFLDANGQLVAEHGRYDAATAVLTTADTKVYEAVQGLDAAVAAATGLPAGESFHFVLNNVWIKDNRIPPRGFSNAAFEAVQAAPVAYSYADGQYWDDTAFDAPWGARQALVRVLHQTTTREYIEFLRDTNTTNSAGAIAYEQWLASGRSPPIEMDSVLVKLRLPGDLNGDGRVDVLDMAAVLEAFHRDNGGDADSDGDTDSDDLDVVLWFFGQEE